MEKNGIPFDFRRPASANIAVAGVVGGLMGLARYLSLETKILVGVSAGLLTVLLKRPAKTYSLQHFEATPESDLRAGLSGDQDVD